ncbi:MAG: hypothetical protein ACLFPJ_04255 [Candidatus Woesearchaeota archaeon]
MKDKYFFNMKDFLKSVNLVKYNIKKNIDNFSFLSSNKLISFCTNYLNLIEQEINECIEIKTIAKQLNLQENNKNFILYANDDFFKDFYIKVKDNQLNYLKKKIKKEKLKLNLLNKKNIYNNSKLKSNIKIKKIISEKNNSIDDFVFGTGTFIVDINYKSYYSKSFKIDFNSKNNNYELFFLNDIKYNVENNKKKELTKYLNSIFIDYSNLYKNFKNKKNYEKFNTKKQIINNTDTIDILFNIAAQKYVNLYAIYSTKNDL